MLECWDAGMIKKNAGIKIMLGCWDKDNAGMIKKNAGMLG